LEDKHRLHYEPWELKQFEHRVAFVFTYLLLDGFRGDKEQVKDYQERLEPLLVGGWVVSATRALRPSQNVEAEKRAPHTQPRLPNENVPLVWAHRFVFAKSTAE